MLSLVILNVFLPYNWHCLTKNIFYLLEKKSNVKHVIHLTVLLLMDDKFPFYNLSTLQLDFIMLNINQQFLSNEH